MPIDFERYRDPAGEQSVPPTLDEAVDFLYQSLNDEEREIIRESGAEQFHFTVGMALRNHWNLWGNQPDVSRALHEHFVKVHNKAHADSMSSMILRALQERCGYRR